MEGLLSQSTATQSAAGLNTTYFSQLIKIAVAVEKQPISRLQTQRDQLQVRRSVYDQVNARLASVESLARSLAAGSSSIFGAKTVSSSDTSVVTATVSSSATPATYDVNVTTLAKAHRVRSDQQANSDQALGLSGTFVIGGAASRSVANASTVANTVTGFATASVTSGLTELGTSTYHVEVQNNNGTDQFRVVDSDGNAIAIDDAGSGGTTTTTAFQNLSLVQGTTFDTGRGLTITFGNGPFTTGSKGSGAASVDYRAQGASITVNSTDSLNVIRDAINAATYADGNEVLASVVDNHLVLEAANTGSAHRVRARDTSGTLLETLGVRTPGGGFKNVLQRATDASFTVNSINVTRPNNAGLDNVISGVTLNLLKEGSSSKITVAQDTVSAHAKISELLTSLNSLMDYLKEQSAVSVSKETRVVTRGTLAGQSGFDQLRRNLVTDMTEQLAGVTGNNPARLSEVGVTLGTDLHFSISNSAALDSALTSNFQGIANLFDGVMQKVLDHIQPFTKSSTGLIDTSRAALDKQTAALDSRIAAINTRAARREEQLIRQYGIYLGQAPIFQQQRAYAAVIFSGSILNQVG
jgi:flagellar hook-associated protein 2